MIKLWSNWWIFTLVWFIFRILIVWLVSIYVIVLHCTLYFWVYVSFVRDCFVLFPFTFAYFSDNFEPPFPAFLHLFRSIGDIEKSRFKVACHWGIMTRLASACYKMFDSLLYFIVRFLDDFALCPKKTINCILLNVIYIVISVTYDFPLEISLPQFEDCWRQFENIPVMYNLVITQK